ncbi:MAG: GtrA family protein [Alphaproteobacteria bacterium]|nr:GtrA family protein [Alphaproteobacteria bacterium]
MAYQFGRFLIVGAAGFAVDFLVYLAMVAILGANGALARCAASAAAISFTWMLNRHFTFQLQHVRPSLGEFLRYLIASLSGALANFLVFILVERFETRDFHPLAYVLGTAAGLPVNFLLYRTVVFDALSRRAKGRPNHEI